jgi:hypothetical protein
MALILISLMLSMPQNAPAAWAPLKISSGNVLSMRSLHQAFSDDGLEGLEDYLDASLTQVGPRPTELMQGLYENINL